MTSKRGHHSVVGNCGSSSRLKQYDSARFAVFLGNVAEQKPLHGLARFERDDELGNILRITLPGPGSPSLIISEREWDGLITPDCEHGADYCLILPTAWSADRNSVSAHDVDQGDYRGL
jgi:hypothetical protein